MAGVNEKSFISKSNETEKSPSKMHDLHSQVDKGHNVRAKDGGIVQPGTSPVKEHVTGDVNMEADITVDDVVQAGGLGAADDIGSLLPVAADSTDFEESLLDARNFEGPPSEVTRHGLGWKDSTESESSFPAQQ